MKTPAANPRSKDILRALMDPSVPDTVPWSSNELRSILEHQLATPLRSEIGVFSQLAGFTLDRFKESIGNSHLRTFGEVLHHPSPPVGMLRLIKDFAKLSLTSDDGVPRDVARVLYVCAILRARSLGSDLTRLTRSGVEREARRCLAFAWLPESIRALLRVALCGIAPAADPRTLPPGR